MSEINDMNFKQLRDEVQRLRDELARMKRSYEDILYNLDDSNFSAQFIKEKENMKSQISQTSESIQTFVGKNINTSVAISAESLAEATDTSKIYRIPDSETYKYYYFNSVSEDWEEVPDGGNINTMFTQTSNGFELRGNTVIDGKTVITKDLTLSGTITWDMENSPVKTQYSVDSESWSDEQVDGYKYMRMSFDGGETWNEATKVVGDDGRPGSSASVTFEKVNSLLGNLFTAGTTKIGNSYAAAPELYGCKIYAGDGDGQYAQMDEDGFKLLVGENAKIKIGVSTDDTTSWQYPYITLGVGGDNALAGLIKKISDGLWIGTASAAALSATHILNIAGDTNSTGFFISCNTSDLGIYKVIKGNKTPIGVAVFG